MKYTFKAFYGATAIEQIASDWDAVLDTMTRVCFFHQRSWHEVYIQTLLDELDELRFFVAYADKAPVAVIPLRLGWQCRNGIPVRVLRFPEHPHLPFFDFIFEPSHEQSTLIPEFIEYLRHTVKEPWEVLSIGNVLADSSVWVSLTDFPIKDAIVDPGPVCDYLDTTPYELQLEKMSKNFRGGLRKARNKLAKESEVEFVTVTDTENVKGALEMFYDVEGSGWKGTKGSAIKCSRRLLAFYGALAARYSQERACEINLLKIAGNCIAAQFCLRYNNCLYILKIGYDESHSRLAPGNMLLEMVVKRCISEGSIEEINLISDAAWHASWKPLMHERNTVIVFNKTVPGQIARSLAVLKNRLRPTVRTHIKPPLNRIRNYVSSKINSLSRSN